jgi:hypothetical protein
VADLLFSFLHGGETRPGMKRYHILFGGITRVARSLDVGEVLEVFEGLVQLGVAEASPRFAFIHAGVVGWRGRAILVPGYSYSGKTSLVAALVKSGATYYSDEYAVLDESGRVHPFARPLRIRRADRVTADNTPVESLGGRAGKAALPVAMVIETSYRENKGRWRPRRGTTGHAALALASHAVPIRRRPDWTIARIGRAVNGAVHWKGPRGEADAAARLILSRAHW